MQTFNGTWIDQTFDACETNAYAVDIALDAPHGATDWSFLAERIGTVFLRGLDCPCQSHYPNLCFCDPLAMALTADLLV